MNREGGAVALTAESGLLTFTPQGRIHRQASVIDIWERLDVQATALTHHGLRLNAYFDQEPVEDVVLMPPPLKIVVEPWWTDLIRSIGAPANQVARFL